jgi:hypothetical protein
MPVKSNLVEPRAGLDFVIKPQPGGAVPRLVWDQDRVSQFGGWPMEERSTMTTSYKDHRREFWLRGVLAGGPVPAEEVAARAERDGLTGRELDDAKQACGIVERQDAPGGPVLWALPLEPPEPDAAEEGQEAESAAKEAAPDPTAFSRGEKAPVGREADGRMRGQEPDAGAPDAVVQGRDEVPSPALFQGAPSPEARGQEEIPAAERMDIHPCILCRGRTDRSGTGQSDRSDLSDSSDRNAAGRASGLDPRGPIVLASSTRATSPAQ